MKIFILTTVMAPYRIDVFNEMGKECDLVVCFEQKKDNERDNSWYKENIRNFRLIKAKGWEKTINYVKFCTIQYLKQEKPDLVIFYEYSTKTAMLLMQYCIEKKIKYLINCDGAFIDTKKNIKKYIKTHYIKNAIGCLANGKSAKNYFLYYGAKEKNIFSHNFSTLYKNDILERPLKKDEKKKLRDELKLCQSKRIFLCVGNYIDRKGYDLIIKAANELKEENIEFVNIGCGNKKEEYQKLIEEYGLKNIVLEGFKDKETLKKYYDSADVFLFPTKEDIWGLVVNEAMARGLPVITTDRCNAGLELIENNKNGEIIKTNSCEELVKAIRKYLTKLDDELYKQGEKSIKKIKEYTIENIAKSHIEVLNQLCKENK